MSGVPEVTLRFGGDGCPGGPDWMARRLRSLAEAEGRGSNQDVMRWLADALDPKPSTPEPGRWAIVAASCVHDDTRREWVHVPGVGWCPASTLGGGPENWDSLRNPQIIRDGI